MATERATRRSPSRCTRESRIPYAVRYSVSVRWCIFRLGLLPVACPEPVQSEVCQAILLAEKLFLQVRHDGMLPDQGHPLLAEVLAQEVTGADGGVAVPQELIGPVHDVGHPQQVRLLPGEPAPQQPLDG